MTELTTEQLKELVLALKKSQEQGLTLYAVIQDLEYLAEVS